MGQIIVYDKEDNIKYRRTADVESRLSNRTDGLELHLSGLDDISVVQLALRDDELVKIIHGEYHAYADSIKRYECRNGVSNMELFATPFYKEGLTYNYTSLSSVSPMIVNPSKGNCDGIISKMSFSYTGTGWENVRVHHEQTSDTTLPILDSNNASFGSLQFDGGAYGWSYMNYQFVLESPSWTSTLGTYDMTLLPDLLKVLDGKPRSISYNFFPTYWSPRDSLVFKGTCSDQSTQWSTWGPIIATHTFNDPKSFGIGIKGGPDVESYPLNVNINVDWVGFYPHKSIYAYAAPNDIDDFELSYEFRNRGMSFVSNGRVGDVIGNPINTSTSLPTRIYDLVCPVDGYSLMRLNRVATIETLDGYRLPTSRLE